MLRIVSKPEDFTPIKEGLLFVVEADEKCDLDVAIINAYTGEEVGRKVIYDTMRAVVDIAPYVADMPQFAPSKQGETELMSLPVISYMIVAQSADEVVESDEVLVSNNIVAEKVGVNSIFAVDECREIAYGQSDHLLIKAPAAGMITAEVSADYGESYSYNVYSGSGRAMFSLSTQMFEQDVERIVVEIYCNGEFLQSVDYEIIPKIPNAVRVAWISDIGTLEHFTFAALYSRTLVAKQRRIFVGSAGQTSSCTPVEWLNIGSARCSERVAEALATIVTAPKVWIERDGQYVEAMVVENEVVISKFAKVGQISLTLEHNRKEVAR